MAEKTFNQEFKGYWRDKNKGGLPSYSGVYVVQSCVYINRNDSVTLKQLIYIGKADNVCDRVKNHEKYEDWKKELNNGEELCYSSTEISTMYNERVEAALINANQPKVNTEYKNSFPFDKTHVNSTGRYSKLKKNITVERH